MISVELKNTELKDNDKIIFQDFDKIKVSTKTFIVMTNITLNIDKLFNKLPITSYIVIPKKRGRKKKVIQIDPNLGIKSGSIITLEYETKLRGVDLKKKKKKKSSRNNYFRNSVTVIMIIDDKKINFKISRNGKFQITGCKFDDHAEKCVKYIWDYIKDDDDIFKFNNYDIDSDSDDEEENIMKATFIPAMRNIDFGLGFLVDREKLDRYFNVNTRYHSLLEPSFGYTGVNIKIPIVDDILKLNLKQLRNKNGKWIKPATITYNDYLQYLPQKERLKKTRKDRYNTFLVFHSGKVIMSGLEASFMRDTYYEFGDIINDCSNIIREKLS